MNQSKPDGSSQDEMAKLLETLTPEEQEALRRKLNEKAWGEQFDKLGNSIKNPPGLENSKMVGKRCAGALQHLIDRLSSGDIDEDIKKACRIAWEGFFVTVQSQDNAKSEIALNDDLQKEQDTEYEQAQYNLIQLRQTVAQAVVSEKQLEQQIQKNKDQAETWQNRANMAAQQNNEELCRQAMQRKDIYANTALALENQHKVQKDRLIELRDRFNKLEAEIQKVSTLKQILITRDKVAEATARANALLAKTTSNSSVALLERMQQKVSEKESIASQLSELSESANAGPEKTIEAMLAKAVTSIERLTSVVENLERKVSKDEINPGTLTGASNARQ